MRAPGERHFHAPETGAGVARSEERRVGKEGRYWRDWSSDVCSSDLAIGVLVDQEQVGARPGALEVHGAVAYGPARVASQASLAAALDGGAGAAQNASTWRAALPCARNRRGGCQIGRASCRERGEILA